MPDLAISYLQSTNSQLRAPGSVLLFRFYVGVKNGHPRAVLHLPDRAGVERARRIFAIKRPFNLHNLSRAHHVFLV